MHLYWPLKQWSKFEKKLECQFWSQGGTKITLNLRLGSPVLTTFLTFGSSDGLGKSPSDTNLCFVDPKCCVNCCCELTDNSQMLQYNSVVWLSFEMHSGNGSGNFIFSDAFGRSLFAKRFYILAQKWHIFLKIKVEFNCSEQFERHWVLPIPYWVWVQ